ncbi:hypothetical protein K1719_019676 [Acacia pycnantha]|nr:hypothetical protein K1719_019676 [Acacia pycnantha]
MNLACLFQSHKDYKVFYANAFISDLTADDLNKEISPSLVDIVTMVADMHVKQIFMLFAVSPEKRGPNNENLQLIADAWTCGVTLFVSLVGAYPFYDALLNSLHTCFH